MQYDVEWQVGDRAEDTDKEIIYVLVSKDPEIWQANKYELVRYPDLDIIREKKDL